MIDPAWIGLCLTGRIGNKTLQALLKHFDGDTSAILQADTKALRQVSGVGPKIAQNIQEIDLRQVEKALARWQQSGIHIWTIRDSQYPERLKTLDDAPPTLFVRGNVSFTFERSIAIVGTRSPSNEMRNFAQNLSTALVEKGYSIISGMALGIDSAAHFGALGVPDGQTAAVLGSGIVNIYPPAHERLAREIMVQGLVLSEISPNATTSPSNLVARNRIISGLSEGLIVVETSVDGGAMHAARFASLQGRTLYTVESQASGNQALIGAGATVIPMNLAQLPF
ncbi:MAG: DNA-protecting protein DprA [Chloroflexi bacterium]|nr:DNA-protecting protein DprA [Chloroflexota bacterium]MCC6893595.1 DNA-processing protein DprA [Anaerolineae bacterium]